MNIWLSKDFMKRRLIEALGCFLGAIGIYNFAVPAKFPMVGFSGVAMILYQLFSIPIGIGTILLNIPVAIWCYRLLGKNFFIRSIWCMVLSSAMVDYIAPLFPVYTGSRLLAAICAGVVSGYGYALIYKQNSSTGGADFIMMGLKVLHPHIQLGKIILIFDMGVILLGGLVYREIDGVIYGGIVTYILAEVVDKFMYGVNAGKLAFIVTSNGQKISNVIGEKCNRGSTIFKAQGGYRGDQREMVMCACNNKEMYQVQKVVKEEDPESFVIILESNEVHGKGFHMLQFGDQK